MEQRLELTSLESSAQISAKFFTEVKYFILPSHFSLTQFILSYKHGAASTAKKNAPLKKFWNPKSFEFLQANPCVDSSSISLWSCWYLCSLPFLPESGVSFWSESTSCPYLACFGLQYGLSSCELDSCQIKLNW